MRDRLDQIEQRLERVEELLLGFTEKIEAVRAAVTSLEEALESDDDKDGGKDGDKEKDGDRGKDGEDNGDVEME